MSSFDPVTVTIQPGGPAAFGGTAQVPDDWLPYPPQSQVPNNCPPGLEHFATLDEIYINQKISWKEICFGCEWNQKYDILDPRTGKKIYFAAEDTPFCTRFWCANGRSLEMSILDHMNREVVHMSRPFKCAGMMLPPCLDEFHISSPDGRLLGSVRQLWDFCKPKFNVLDANGDVVFEIKGPCWHCKCCDEVPFKIYVPGERTEVGLIAKRWSGTAKECCTDVDNFRIEFPRNLDVRLRACLLGACFSIDLLFFENQDQ